MNLLKSSYQSPSRRPDFYKLLLKSDLLLLCHDHHTSKAGAPGRQSRDTEPLAIETWSRASGEAIIPVFSSANSVRLGIKSADAIWLNAKQIFKMLKKTWFVLDPFSPTGREFSPLEVTQLLRGELTKPAKIVKAKKLASLGEYKLKPIRKPSRELLKDLVEICRSSKGVQKAYIASIAYRKGGRAPLLSILLRCKTPHKALITDMSLTVLEHFQSNSRQFVDVITMSTVQEREIAKFGIKPFYRAL